MARVRGPLLLLDAAGQVGHALLIEQATLLLLEDGAGVLLLEGEA